MTIIETSNEPDAKTNVVVFIALLVIVAIEVFLTYRRLSTHALLASLLTLAVIEAALGVMYFMHLRYERRALFLSLIPAIIFVLLMMNYLWPDAMRLNSMRLPTP